MKKVLLLLLFVVFVQAPSAYADCLACSEFKGVSVTLNDGRKINGYVEWNDSWPEENFVTPPKMWSTPESIVIFAKNNKSPVKIYKKVIFFNEIFSFYDQGILNDTPFVPENEMESISPTQIKSITFYPQKYDEFNSTGLQVISTEVVSQLKKQSVAKYCYGGEVADTCLISYNKSYGEKELTELTKKKPPSTEEEYKANNILNFYFSWD